MFETLNDNIPLKAFVLRVKRIMEQKGYVYNSFESSVYNTSNGAYVTLVMVKGNYQVDIAITPLEDEIYLTICDKDVKMLVKGFIELDNLVKLNIDKLLTKNVSDGIIEL